MMVVLLFCTTILQAQNQASDPIRPKWMNHPPVTSSSTFIYQIVSASASCLDAARKETVVELMTEAGLKTGSVIIQQHNAKENVSQVWENGKLKETIKNDFNTETSSKSKEMMLHASIIDEYWTYQAGQYHVHRLYAKSELGKMPLYDDVIVTTQYHNDFAAIGLSFLPGAAQIYKGSTMKGGIIMGGAIALGSSAAVCGLVRQDCLAKMANTHSAEMKQRYMANANKLNTGMYACLGCLGALYIYNIIDAMIAPGAKRLIITPSGVAISF